MEIKKEYPARVIRASINGKELLLIVWRKEGKYLGSNFRPIYLTSDEQREVCAKLAQLRHEIKGVAQSDPASSPPDSGMELAVSVRA